MATPKGGLGRGIGSLIPGAGRPAGAKSPIPAPRPAVVTAKSGSASKASGPAKKPAKGQAGASKAVSSKAPAAKAPAVKATKAAAAKTSTKPGASTAKQPKPAGKPQSSTELLPVPGAEFAEIEIALIVPNAKQPRKNFEPEAFAELVHSVREFGVLQPIVVRPLSKKAGKAQYELIMGERRLRASKEAGLARIPAIIRDTANEHMLRDALLENLHRAELNPLEEASAYQQLLEDFGITQDELADRMGRSRPQITNTIRLLKLPTSIQLKVASGVLSAGHARAILGASATRREYWANRVINEGLSVRAIEEYLALEKNSGESGNARGVVKPAARLEILEEMEAKLANRVSTRVRIKMNNKKGQIVIEFANLTDLKRILNELDPGH